MKAFLLSIMLATGMGLTISATVEAAGAIATSDGENPGMSVEVTELKRSSGDTITLKFAMLNNTSEQHGFGYTYGDYSSVSAVHLVDAVNKKKYLVVRDTEGTCLCSVFKGYIPVGGRANLWIKFPAPPADVKVISVVIPHFTPMDDVPISP